MGKITVASINWGFLPGGISKYIAVMDTIDDSSVCIKQICIRNKKWKIDDINLKKIQPYEIFITSRFDLSWIIKLYHILEDINPNFVMTHGFNGHFVALVVGCIRKRKTPLICSYHGFYHGSSCIKKILGFFYDYLTLYMFRRHVLSITCVSKFSKKYLVSKKIKENKIHVIHNGIKDITFDSFKVKKFRKKFELKDSDVLIGVISRLDPVKYIQYVIEAVKRLDDLNCAVKLVVVGSGPYEKELRKLVSSYNLERKIFFAGFVEDVSSAINALDIFIIPSKIEAHSISLLEAMRSQKTIIATDVGGNPESIRDNVEGILVPSGSSKYIADAITRLLKDPILMKNLSENARKRYCEKFTDESFRSSFAKWILCCIN